MNSSENIDTERIGRALAMLHQKVEAVLKIAPGLIEINSLDEFQKKEAKVVEDQLWSIFAYGEYYVEKVMSNLATPILSVKGKENYDYYRKEYKPFSKKICALIGATNPPSREMIERKIVEIATNSLNKDIWEEPIMMKADIDNHLDFYEHKITSEPLINLIKLWCDLIRDAIPKIPDSTPKISPADKDNPIKNCFEFSLDYVRNVYIPDQLEWGSEDEDWEEKKDLSNANKLVSKPYFSPDDWIANEEYLSPILVTRKIEHIPTHIKARVDEIHKSFIFGNHMSVIALSRCLLEYVIIDRKPLLEKFLDKDIKTHHDKGRTKPIGELSDIAGKVFPQLTKNMKRIITCGNEIMHPDKKIVPNKERTKGQAKDCVDGITTIISTLYSAQIKPSAK